jgi:hypothetical protein
MDGVLEHSAAYEVARLQAPTVVPSVSGIIADTHRVNGSGVPGNCLYHVCAPNTVRPALRSSTVPFTQGTAAVPCPAHGVLQLHLV